MARGIVLGVQTRTMTNLLLGSVARFSISPTKRRTSITSPKYLPSTPLSCKCSHAQTVEHLIDMSKYRETFSRRMDMAGLKPHHRIALGVSGGPDSMALCVLTAGWKTRGCNGTGESGEFIDGLLAITVDHGLRKESKEEADIVSRRVSDMGIRCEIVHCDWLGSKPKQGHLQEAARDMRYQIFQKVCIQHQIGVLLIAHHADDQAELFILRLSRNSGVLGLAGMPFSSQIFSSHACSCDKDLKNHAILLVRPLLDFSKEDMYKICQGGKQDWVEDPTNRSPLFVRNRIRMSLGDLSSSSFRSELQAVISACRRTRSYVKDICCNLLNRTVTIMDQGYAVIDLRILNPSKIEDICLSKFLALVLQFISQRQRPIRGSTSKLLLDYIRTFPCKTSLTAAGCYICPAPGSRGTKALVCCSVDCPLPQKMELFQTHSNREHRHCVPNLEQIIADAKSYSDHMVPDASELLLGMTTDSVLTEAKRLNILSESTYRNILLLQREENKHFKLNTEVTADYQSTGEVECVSLYPSEPLQPGQVCYFMNRFFVIWKLSNDIPGSAFPEEVHCGASLGGESWNEHCSSCVISDNKVAEVRHMIESDWLYLAKLSEGLNLSNLQRERDLVETKTKQKMGKANICSDYARLSAKGALSSLKSVPVAARRSLPVLVSSNGKLLSIPNINFNLCPCLMVSAEFKPKVPLGGGHSSFI